MKDINTEILSDMVAKFYTVECNINVRMVVLDHILSLTSSLSGIEIILEAEVIAKIIEAIDLWGPDITAKICKILVNMSADDKGYQVILDVPLATVIHKLLKIIQTCELSADYACMVLCNLSRIDKDLDLIIAGLAPLENSITSLLEIFMDVSRRKNGVNYDQIAMLFCNLSRHKDFQKFIMNRDGVFLNSILPFIEFADSSIRRQGIVGTIRNCSFVVDEHDWLLREQNILPRILLPLTGNENFTDEENDQIPLDLQYMSSTKEREPDPSIRRDLIEVLNKFCTTEVGRAFMRKNGVYFILREYHKWEKEVRNIFACVNVVDILIRTEDEIGLDNLVEDIPDDILQQMEQVRINLGSSLESAV